MKTRQGVLVVCCLGLLLGGSHAALAQQGTTVKVLSVDVSNNVVRNKEKGLLVKVKVKREGVVRLLGWSAAVEVLDKKDAPLLSLHAKKVIADNPDLFPNGDIAGYVLGLNRPTKKPLGLNPRPLGILRPMSILEGPYSGPWGTFCDNCLLFFDGGGKDENTQTVELFLPLSQFPISGVGAHELTLRARVYEEHDKLGQLLSSQSDPIPFTYEVKNDSSDRRRERER